MTTLMPSTNVYVQLPFPALTRSTKSHHVTSRTPTTRRVVSCLLQLQYKKSLVFFCQEGSV